MSIFIWGCRVREMCRACDKNVLCKSQKRVLYVTEMCCVCQRSALCMSKVCGSCIWCVVREYLSMFESLMSFQEQKFTWREQTTITQIHTCAMCETWLICAWRLSICCLSEKRNSHHETELWFVYETWLYWML